MLFTVAEHETHSVQYNDGVFESSIHFQSQEVDECSNHVNVQILQKKKTFIM
jgi:hypothetical protein